MPAALPDDPLRVVARDAQIRQGWEAQYGVQFLQGHANYDDSASGRDRLAADLAHFLQQGDGYVWTLADGSSFTLHVDTSGNRTVTYGTAGSTPLTVYARRNPDDSPLSILNDHLNADGTVSSADPLSATAKALPIGWAEDYGLDFYNGPGGYFPEHSLCGSGQMSPMGSRRHRALGRATKATCRMDAQVIPIT